MLRVLTTKSNNFQKRLLQGTGTDDETVRCLVRGTALEPCLQTKHHLASIAGSVQGLHCWWRLRVTSNHPACMRPRRNNAKQMASEAPSNGTLEMTRNRRSWLQICAKSHPICDGKRRSRRLNECTSLHVADFCTPGNRRFRIGATVLAI